MEFKKNEKLALCVLIGLALIGISVHFARRGPGYSSRDMVLAESGSSNSARVTAMDSDTAPNDNPNRIIVFQVAGCVKSPGVYKLPEGNRINDAIATAGGATMNADLQSLNLARKIEDGERIDVPPLRSSTAAPVAMMPASNASSASGNSSSGSSSAEKFRNPGDGTVSINSADVNSLQQLPGVGPSTAQKIVDYRNQIGRFSSPEQLMDVKGIGPKKYEKMRQFVTL